MNGARDELLAGACLPLDEYSGIRGRDVFDLLEHLFQRRAAAYNLLKSTGGRTSIMTIEHLGSKHRDLLQFWNFTSINVPH
jgi:hypothetical protein